MNERTYISQIELDRFLSYLKMAKLWNYYIIVYNLVLSQKSYGYFQRKGVRELNMPEGIPTPEKNPFDLKIRTINKQLKIYQAKSGIRGVTLTTKIFSRRFIVKGEVFYGILEKHKISYKKSDEGFLYVVKHSHRNPEISKLLTDKKVGISFDYKKRVESLTLGTIGIEVLRTWKMNKDLVNFMEKKLHDILKERKLIGEWFSDDDGKLIEIIDKSMESLTPSKVT